MRKVILMVVSLMFIVCFTSCSKEFNIIKGTSEDITSSISDGAFLNDGGKLYPVVDEVDKLANGAPVSRKVYLIDGFYYIGMRPDIFTGEPENYCKVDTKGNELKDNPKLRVLYYEDNGSTIIVSEYGSGDDINFTALLILILIVVLVFCFLLLRLLSR